MTMTRSIHRSIIGSTLLFISSVAFTQSFVTFESDQFRPLAMSPDGNLLFATNTPDGTLEIFDATLGDLVVVGSVAVGLEPVAVAARTNTEVWVVNRLSDSVSIVDLSGSAPRVVRTLLVGDEPADIVFAGPGNNRAFITAAHRGQNSPYVDAANPGEFITPGIGRADVWVFDAANPGAGLGGDPITIVTLFGDTSGPLARSADGGSVYAAVLKSGNQTTALSEGVVCNGGAAAAPCQPASGEQTAIGGLPAPNVDSDGISQPEAGLIVKFDGAAWRDELGRDWSNHVRFNLPDLDVFVIDANAATPVEVNSFAGVGTILYAMAVNPATGKIYVANTDANNAVRFEGSRPGGSTVSTVQGNLHKARITIIDENADIVTPRHLNKHIDYSVTPAPAGIKNNSLAIPSNIVVTADGATLYVAAKGSGKVGVFSVTALESDAFVPDETNHVTLSGGGPTGLALDEGRDRLYVLTRFDNSISVIDTVTRTEIAHHSLFNPEPASVVTGRPFLYDANLTSSNGEAACGTCHLGADKDELAWDLGDPEGSVTNNPNPFTLGPFFSPDFHPMKGPMTTQTLRGMDNHGPMHWRGDRTAGNDPGGDPLDEAAAFKKFNPAFVGLLGRAAELTANEMQAFTDFILQVTPPPNPVRALDDSLNPAQQAGMDFYFNAIVDTTTCNGCHTLAPAAGFFGTNGGSSFEGEPQHMKIPQLRNMYEKVGMFGMSDVGFFNPGDNQHMGDQIRGFGFTHDGSADTLLRFFRAVVFQFPGDVERLQVEQFMFAIDSNLKPVVGQQITLSGTNADTVNGRVDLLVARAAAGDADVTVKGLINGEQRGWQLLGNGDFESDKLSEPNLTGPQLRALPQQTGQELTFTAVPPGSGTRIGIDRDEDGLLNRDDNCPNLANPGQVDSNANGIGDACEPLIIGPVVLPAAFKDEVYPQQTLTVFNGQSPYTWSITGGTLPFGLTLSPGGVISGTPTTLGTASFTAKVTDTNGATATQDLQISVQKNGAIFPGYDGPCGTCHTSERFR